VDRYQIGLYKSLAINYGGGFGIHEAPYLSGFKLGNSRVPGCLTSNYESRLHSCEPGMFCSASSSRPSVFICPIVNRTNDGFKIPEHGVGGGGGDLYQSHELELPDEFTFQQLEKVCREQLQDEAAFSKAMETLTSAFNSENKTLSLDTYGLKAEHEIPLKELVLKLSCGKPDILKNMDSPPSTVPSSEKRESELPKSIVRIIITSPIPPYFYRKLRSFLRPTNLSMQEFPYSRHSSYEELLNLIEAFRPKDVFPCTVDEKTWCDEVSMQNLFGHLCSGKEFAHDRHMRETFVNNDREWSRKIPSCYPEPHSVPTTESREQQSTSQSFVGTKYATNSHPSKKGERPSPTDEDEPAMLLDREDIEIISSPEQQNTMKQGIKRTYEMVSSSPPSSFSSPHMGKLHAIKQALKALPTRADLDNRPILQYDGSAPPVQEPRDDLENETGEELAPIEFSNFAGDVNEITDDEHPNNKLNDIQGRDQESEPEIESQNTVLSYSEFGSQTESQSFPGGLNTSPRSLRRRIEVYRVAQSGTYTDWVAYAPMSSGNNHTEEEIEL
jgi:DNA cross-link repair 1C protein